VNFNNSNGCSALNPTQLNVTVNPQPGAAGNITGSTTVCGGAQGIVYSTSAIANAITYVWSVPTGATIVAGAGTTSITVDYAANASSGSVTVYGNNLCGNGTTSSLAVTVNALPNAAGTITGSSAVCKPENGVIYSVPAIANATGYSWTVPSGATIVSGNNTNSITVNFPANATSGNVTVAGTNTCGNGTTSTLAVTVNPTPATPVATANGATLTSSAMTGNQWIHEGTVIPGATGQTYTANQSGWYWVVVSVNGCTSDTSNHVYVLMTGINTFPASQFTLYPVPNDGKFTVEISSAVQDTYTLEIFNMLGSRIYVKSGIEVTGNLTMNVDLRPVPDGIYTVVLRNAEGKAIRKMIVDK
jgi:hypothetical protein